jgi:heterotetrameric sarcosine oxidase gamma subunit
LNATLRIRRSPLAARHVALGARWESEVSHWPLAYASPDQEAAALRKGAGLNDWGPVDKYLVKGPAAAESAAAVAPGLASGRIASTDAGGQAVILLRLAQDESLFVLPFGGPAGLPEFLGAARPRMVDLSSGLSSFRLAGPNARRILEELCPVDLADAVVPNLSVLQAPLANIHSILARIDHAGVPVFALFVPRDLAEYTWDALLASGKAHGLVPVGGRALDSLR